MNPKLLRNLIIGNLAVYTVVAGLIGYTYLFPAETTTFASQDPNLLTNAPFISIMLPTPTPYGEKPAPISPQAVKTLVPLETPVPVTPSPGGVKPDLQAKPATVKDQGLVPPSAINILLMGTDRRPGAMNWRTDTLILVSVNQQDKTVGLLSIPRDLYVDIPNIGKQRINTADFYGEYYHYPGGGPRSIKETIERNLGIRVHYYVRGGFDGFRKAIDTLGGINVDVDCPLSESGFYDDYGRADLNFQPGLQTMDGVTALRYARSRYTTNDYDRSRRQRKVMLAMWDKTLSLNLLPKWPELFNQMQDSIQTDLGPSEMAGLAWIGSQLQMDHIKSMAIDNRVSTPYITPAGEWVLLPNAEKIHALLVDFFASPTQEVDAVEQEQARVQLVSGNPEAADLATVFLRRQGITVTESQDAISLAPKSVITVYNNKPATLQRLQNVLRINPASVQTVSDPSAQFDLQVNLGRDYNSCQK